MWRLGTFFHEMAYGLLSVFIPLYIATSATSGGLGGSLLDLGIIMALSVVFTIPSSYYLAEVIGYLPAFIIAGLLFFVAFVCLKVFS